MRLAVFDHVGNYGGGSRFTRALLLALKNDFPEMDITFYCKKSSMLREGMEGEFLKSGIRVEYLNATVSLKDKLPFKIIRSVFKKICNIIGFSLDDLQYDQVHKEIKTLAIGYDIAFFPWPYLIEFPQVDCPAVAVFHDFNYKYFFGGKIYSQTQVKQLNAQISEWLLHVTPVVSSRFIASEIEKFYPGTSEDLEIVHLAPFDISDISHLDAHAIVKKLGIRAPFILYPCNLCAHKNIGTLLRAFYLLKKKGVALSVVFTGPGTDCVTGTACDFGVDKDTSEPDVIGLGYVSNMQMDALVQCAKIVISTSLYEAGNGPGLEAWGRGVPVVMSDIPSFTEHIEVLGVSATLVDPRDANDVAEKIFSVLSNYDQAKKDAELSRSNLSKYTWSKVARQYYDIFNSQLRKSN